VKLQESSRELIALGSQYVISPAQGIAHVLIRDDMIDSGSLAAMSA
jgi:hypothetical protein